MKTVLFILLSLLTAQIASAQPDFDTWRKDHNPSDLLWHSKKSNALTTTFDLTQLDSVQTFEWEDNPANWNLTQTEYYSYGDHVVSILRVHHNVNIHYRTIEEYDVQGNITSFFVEERIGTVWVARLHFLYTYNASNQLTDVLNRYPKAGVLEDFSRESYTYDSDGALTQYVEQLWKQNAWQNEMQSVFENNSDHQPTVETIYQWSDRWDPYQRYTLAYGSEKELRSKIDERWSAGWEVESVNEYVYNSDLQLTNDIYNDYMFGVFFRTSQTVYEYDEVGSLITETFQIHDGTVWETYHRTRRTYDAEQYEISVIREYGETQWIYGDSVHYFRSVVSSNKESMDVGDQLRVFPNPASSDIQFHLADQNGSALIYAIVSIDGVQRHEGNAEAKCSIDVSGLPHGIHVLRITSRDGKQYLKCFLKQ